ncbi:MAG: hypothetical protein QNI91_11600 [Arenicellales bacterium]|nr:hypothetical protein [Arenicellales bacterium]
MDTSSILNYCFRVDPWGEPSRLSVVMAKPPRSTAVGRFAQTYPGIEGFYFLNQKGELGYITGKNPRLVKETFNEWKDEGFLKRYPRFKQEVKAFGPFLVDLYQAYPSTPEMELGYIVPSDESSAWNTATLVVHEHIVNLMQEAVKQSAKERLITLDEADRKLAAMTVERGIYQGLDDLFNHVSALGGHPFFPAFYHSRNPVEQTGVLRVINLKYVNPESGNTAKFEAVYSLLRSKLTARGALNPAQRIEHRFTIEGE